MPKKFTTSGYKCNQCGKKYTGKGSLKRAESCEQNPIPTPLLSTHSKWLANLDGGMQVGVEITGFKISAKLNDEGWPVKHYLVYTAVSFAFTMSGGNWIQSEDAVIITEDEAKKLAPWVESMVII